MHLKARVMWRDKVNGTKRNVEEQELEEELGKNRMMRLLRRNREEH